ncbi:MAG: hypothetical protein JNK74_20725 [Candidatus Hydrogenedentes bacterium]|nr:hypothetical protein [Candidatus Hydrogenedentota bacterium]
MPMLPTIHSRLRCLSLVPLLFLVTMPAHAEAIPVAPDRKSVTVDSYTVPLNDDQRKDVEQRRKLTLTDEQMAPLRAICDTTPNTIDVVSSQYDSCTCGMGVYAIWCRPGEVEIPWTSVEAELEKKAEPPTADAEPGPETGTPESTRVIVDAAGKLYLDGKECQEADVMALIDTLHERQKENDWVSWWITLDIPPPIDEATDTRIHERAARIEAHCKARNVGFWGLGISADKFR